MKLKLGQCARCKLFNGHHPTECGLRSPMDPRDGLTWEQLQAWHARLAKERSDLEHTFRMGVR